MSSVLASAQIGHFFYDKGRIIRDLNIAGTPTKKITVIAIVGLINAQAEQTGPAYLDRKFVSNEMAGLHLKYF